MLVLRWDLGSIIRCVGRDINLVNGVVDHSRDADALIAVQICEVVISAR